MPPPTCRRPIRQAILLLVAHWYEHREPVEIGAASAPLPAMVSELLAALPLGAPMTRPRIGALRERLDAGSPEPRDDGGGGAVVTWTAVAELWAAVRPITGDERLRHDAVTGRVTHEVWIRHRADVVPAMRFATAPASSRSSPCSTPDAATACSACARSAQL